MDYEKVWLHLENWIEESAEYLILKDEKKYQTIQAVKEMMESLKRLYV
jgi:hypothetical protein